MYRTKIIFIISFFPAFRNLLLLKHTDFAKVHRNDLNAKVSDSLRSTLLHKKLSTECHIFFNPYYYFLIRIIKIL